MSVDREFENFSGYNKIEIIGKNIDKLFSDKEEVIQLKEKILNLKSITNEKKIFLKKNNGKVPVILSVMTREDEDKNVIGYFISFIDVSESDKYEEELRIRSEKLKKLDKLKNEFIANITHDFRSPLTAILNIADIALKSRPDNENKENYEIIYKASLRLKSSIDKLLEIAKMDALGVKLNIKRIELVSFINKILDFYCSSLVNTGIKIEKKLPENKITDFYSDSEKLEEIIDNIISNAIKFIDTNTGIITCEVEVKEHVILIKISDNGIGIPKSKLEAIFNRFEQAHEGRNSIYRGTGIGLAYAKQLVEYLKGRIWAECEGESKGAKFVIEFKKGRKIFNEGDFSNEEDKEISRENLKALIESEIEIKLSKERIKTYFTDLNNENELDYKKGVILIIDDERYVREVIIKYLKSYGYKNFIAASDGKIGLEAVYEYSPDLIICDYNMPNMKGDEIHNQLLDNPKFKEIPFIFLSAIADENLIIERRSKGARAYLSKPIDEKIFIITVEENIKKYFEYLKISQLAIIDELTGLNNRRAIIASLKHELLIRKYRDLSLIFFDIDYFKEINDTYGHQTGDLILSMIGEIVKSSIRSYDMAGRYGGDEFIIILLDTNLEKASYVAEVLRRKIEKNKISAQDKYIYISASFGVASLKDNAGYIEKTFNIERLEKLYEIEDINEGDWDKIERYKEQISEMLLKMADMSLYKAKQTVCNKCGFSSEKVHIFINNKCPNCDSNDLLIGRNKIVAFNL